MFSFKFAAINRIYEIALFTVKNDWKNDLLSVSKTFKSKKCKKNHDTFCSWNFIKFFVFMFERNKKYTIYMSVFHCHLSFIFNF